MLINILKRASANSRRLSSVSKQACRSLEMVMLEAGSTDDSRTVIESACLCIQSAGIEARADTLLSILPPKGGTRNNDLEQIICCPRCRSQLGRKKSQERKLFCCNSECKYSREGFLEAFGQPVLVDFDNSILSLDAFLRRRGQSYLSRGENRSRVRTRVLKLLLGSNDVAHACCAKFLKQLKKDSNRPRILVIGGGGRGSGADELYDDISIDLVGTDIYASPNTMIVADGHQLPFIDASFDGVWIQAVLEHVLDPSIVVAEIHRVLRPRGLVYADAAFMQQVHENAYDFTRYTVSGLRWLFRNFTTLEAGASRGAGTAFTWSVHYLVRSITGSRKLGRVVSLLFFWTRFLDRAGKSRPNADAASGVYFLGSKAIAPIRPHDMVSFYEQQA
jgi:SAM-dependent methyltransferase